MVTEAASSKALAPNERIYPTKFGDIHFTLWGTNPKNLDVPYRCTATFEDLCINGIAYRGVLHLDYRKGYWAGAEEPASWQWRVERASIRREQNAGAPTDNARHTLYLVTREALDAWQSDAEWRLAGDRFQIQQEIAAENRHLDDLRQQVATCLDVIARKQSELAALS